MGQWKVEITEVTIEQGIEKYTYYFDKLTRAIQKFNGSVPDNWTLEKIAESESGRAPEINHDDLKAAVVVETGVTVSIEPESQEGE